MPLVKGETVKTPPRSSADPAVNPAAAGPIAPIRPAAAPPVRSPGAVKTASEPAAPAVAPVTGPPVPVLQQHGYHGSIQDFNQRVQSVHDSYQAAYGVPPSPGLTFDLAKSPVDTAQFNKLFTVPLAQRVAKAKGALNAQGFTTPPPVTDAKQLAAGIVEAAIHGDYHQFLTVNSDAIREFSRPLGPTRGAFYSSADAATIAGALFKARRLTAFRDVEEKINTGELSPFEGRQQLQAMGFIPGGTAFHVLMGIGGELALGIGQLAEGLVHSPAALIELGKAAGLDTRDIVLHPASQHFQRTAPIAKGAAESIAQDVEHPGQRPGFLFMDILGFASVGGGAVARLGAAGRVLEEGGGALAATRQLARKPPLTRVALRHGDIVEEMPLIDNPVVALVQKMNVNRRQKAADARLAGNAPSGLRSILLPQAAQDFLDTQLSFETKIGRETDARKRVDHDVAMTLARELDHVAGRAVTQARIQAAVPRKIRGALTRGEQKAIQVQSWDIATTPEIASPPAGTVSTEGAYGLPARYPARGKLVEIDPEKLKQVLADLGNPRIGKIKIKGPKTNVTRTSDIEGSMRPFTRDITLRVDPAVHHASQAGWTKLMSKHYSEVLIHELRHAAQSKTLPLWKNVMDKFLPYARQFGEKDAQEFAAAQSEKFHDLVSISTARNVLKGSTAKLQAERDFHNRMIKLGIGDPKAHRAQLANLKLAENAFKNPSPRFLRSLELTQQVVADMERIKIEDLGLAPMTAEGRVAKAGIVLSEGPTIARRLQLQGGIARLEGIAKSQALRPGGVDAKLTARLGKMRTELAALPDPMANPVRATDESFYLPTQRRGKVKRPPSDRAGFYSSKLGPYGLSPGRDLPELTHTFEGKAILAGDIRIDATSLATEAYGRTVRAATIRADHAKHWDAASLTPYGAHSIPIRDVNVISDKLREAMARLDEGDFTPKEAELLPPDMRKLLEDLYPDPKRLTEEEIKDVRWLDARVLGEGVKSPHIPGVGAGVANLANAPLRFVTLFLRPAYILNKLGNHAMGLLDQGWMWPGNFAKAMSADGRYGAESANAIRAHVGAGKSRSYSTSAAGKFSRPVTEFWNRVADRDERVASFIYYAERKGYKTSDEMAQLLNEPETRGDLVEVKRRANKALVEFDNLLPVEKNVLRHFLFVYPWVSRSAVWSIRTALEHPAKVDMLAHLGDLERENDPIFGHAAAWVKRTGYIPLGFNHDGTVRVVNPTSVNSFSTIGDFIALGRGVTRGDKYASAADFLGPAPKFLIHAVTGRDDQGNAYPGSQWWGAAKETLRQLPQIAALERKGKYKPGNAKPPNVADRASLETSLNAALRKTVLTPGWLDGYGSFFLGGLSSRGLNLDASTARYWNDQDPKVRHTRELDLLNRALNVQGEVLQRPVSPAVRAAVRNMAEIDYGYKQFLKETGRDPSDKERANYTISYLSKNGLLSSSAASTWRAKLAPLADKSDIARLHGHLLDKYANGRQLRDWDTAVRTVASFTKPVFNQKAAELFAQGLADQRSYNASQNTLYDYGRRYLAFTETVKKMQADGATDAQLRAFQDKNDVPVNGLPSFVRMAWINQPPEARRAAVQHSTVQAWSTLTAFDKALLGRPSDAKVTAGWAKLKELEQTQRAEAKRQGRSYPAPYTRTLAQYVERYFDAPGLVKDFDFSKQPLYQRMKYLSPVQNSPNKALWGQLFLLADHQYKALKSGNYSGGQLRQQWTDYVTGPDFQAWIGEHPGFKAEIQGFGKHTLVKLIGG